MVTFSTDRAAGVLLGQACGDALGVPYEFGPALSPDVIPQMAGGGLGGFAPGEYSDDTAMAVCIAEVAATGADLTTDDALDEIAQSFLTWAETAPDVGIQTQTVFRRTRENGGPVGRAMIDASTAIAAEQPGHVGNGALMRTSIVGLTRLDDREATAAAAAAVASLTHADPLGVESCILWSEAVRLAVTEGRLDVTAGLDLLPAASRERWRQWIDEAAGADPRTFNPNGFTVWALQAAWAAITWTAVPEDDPTSGTFAAQHFALALENAVRAGNDTDTVAAIAGGLLGAYWGQSAIPHRWTRRVHGYGGHRAAGLVSLAHRTAHRGKVTGQGWPTAAHMTSNDYERARDFSAVHPHDAGVILGTYASTDHGCDAIVSLCRIGVDDFAPSGVAPEDHILVRLVDREDPAENPHLAFVMHEAARAVRMLRDEGKRVFVHCVAAEQRTPTVGIAYSRLLGVPWSRLARTCRSALPSLGVADVFGTSSRSSSRAGGCRGRRHRSRSERGARHGRRRSSRAPQVRRRLWPCHRSPRDTSRLWRRHSPWRQDREDRSARST